MFPKAGYRRSPAKRASLLARFSFLAMLIISLIGIPTLTACGSNNDATIPTAAPTGTPTPAPTVTLDGSTDSGSATPPTQAISLSVPSSGSEELRILSQDSELFELDLNAGDTLVISYSGFAPQGANARTALFVPVDFLILDPANEPLLEASGLVENFVDVQVEISGIHRLVFTNPDRLQSLVVPVDYYSSPSTAAPTAMATPAPTVSQAGSTDPGDTTPPTQAAGLSVPSYGDEMLFIISQDSELIELDLNAGDTLVISYSGYGTQTANARTALLVPVDFLILDPTNEPLLEASGLVENFVDVEVEISGIHRLVFTNPVRLQGLVVPVDYYIALPRQQPLQPWHPRSHRQPRRQHGLRRHDAPHSHCQPLRPLLRRRDTIHPIPKSELIELDLNAGDTLKVSYFTSAAVIGTSTASPPPPPIEFLILDPTNEPLLEVGGLVENFVDVQVEISGTHQLVFTNPARIQGLAVPVKYAINP